MFFSRKIISPLFFIFEIGYFVWVLSSGYEMMIGGMCSLLPYGTGICHYTVCNISLFLIISVHTFSTFLFNNYGTDKSDGMDHSTSMP